MDSIVTSLTQDLSGILSGDLIVFVISLFPILELRGGMLAASFLGLDPERALLLCIAGNLLPMPFILLTVNQIFRRMGRTGIFSPVVNMLERHALEKSGKIQKYEFWGLLLFVGIPLPGTGAWSGALIAALLRIRLPKAMAALTGGILLAALIMTLLSYGVVGLLLHL